MCSRRMPAAFKIALAGWIALCLYSASLLGQSLPGQGKPPAKPNFATTFEQRKIDYLRTLLPSIEKIQNFIDKGESAGLRLPSKCGLDLRCRAGLGVAGYHSTG